ncbi:hypothetical protein Psi01_83600 [Planobispora siamensis]|uniref:Uncharacterized protein n=1 Tax=Planobispora siamensis TaxID=936338 RepID=A0A8J3WQ67_9ACTN|nr:hypothetical protein Psi01_83600 [Planobispora siamensis]
MARPERPVDPEAGVLQRFTWELRELRRQAGNPGYRELSRRAHYAPTTLDQAGIVSACRQCPPSFPGCTMVAPIG